MRRVLCVHLKQWPIDRLCRRQRRYRHEPIAFIKAVGSKQSVVVASGEAIAAGVRAGMSLVEAVALCPRLVSVPHAPESDLRELNALARLLTRFSPVAATEPPNAVLIDVSGCDRLFKGFNRLLAEMSSLIQRLCITATAVIAPTAGAAWALASAGQDQVIVGDAELLTALSPLPVESLRIEEETIRRLRHVGIDTCGQLLDLPRESLPSRFGPDLLERIAQALGEVSEPIVPVGVSSPIAASIHFDSRIDSLATVYAALEHLIQQIVPELERRGRGARRLSVDLRPERGPVCRKHVSLAKPSRSAKHLCALLQVACERWQMDGGCVGLRLAASLHEPLAHDQLALIEDPSEAGAAAFGDLLERLNARLGEGAVTQPELVESHVPESAAREVRVCELRDRRYRAEGVAAGFAVHRPERLLSCVVEIKVIASHASSAEAIPISFTFGGKLRTVAYAIGPERIAPRWWEGRDKTRDYFEVEDEDAERFWIFRVLETGRWFLHGFFG